MPLTFLPTEKQSKFEIELKVRKVQKYRQCRLKVNIIKQTLYSGINPTKEIINSKKTKSEGQFYQQICPVSPTFTST